MKSKVLSSAALLGLALLQPLAAPAAEMVTESRIVLIADLNLDHPAGIETLYRRIRGAARSACGSILDMDPYVRSSARACVRRALAGAVQQVGRADLAAYHSQQRGERGLRIARR